MNGRTLLGAFALLVLGLLTWELRWVLLVLFGAVVLAVALDVPITTARRLLPLNRPAALVGVLLVLVLVGGLLAQLLLPELLDQFNQLTSLLPALAQLLSSLARQISWLPNLERQLMELGTWDRLQPLGSQLLGFAGGAASATVQLVLMALLAILLALDPRSHQKVVVALTPGFWRPQMGLLLSECRQALGGWLAGMTLSAASVFLLTWAGLAMLWVPLALLSALVCGLLIFVPTIGPHCRHPAAPSRCPLGITCQAGAGVGVAFVAAERRGLPTDADSAAAHGQPAAHRRPYSPALSGGAAGTGRGVACPALGGGVAGCL